MTAFSYLFCLENYDFYNLWRFNHVTIVKIGVREHIALLKSKVKL